ncbi:MAG: hypothetical protein Q7S22_04095 [Candidatus Micrarchaeota archaeon]|nr:hypothetical protein [Candidatus Micrarchaeota archaeon]
MKHYDLKFNIPIPGNKLIISPRTNEADIRKIRNVLGAPLMEGVFSDSTSGNVKRLAELVRLSRGQRWEMLRQDVKVQHDINAVFSILLPDSEKAILQPLVDVNADRKRVEIVVTPVEELHNAGMLTPAHILDNIMQFDKSDVFIAYPLDYHHYVGIVMVAVLRELGYEVRVAMKYKLMEIETADGDKQFHINPLISAALIEPSNENELIVMGFGSWNVGYNYVRIFDDQSAVGVVGLLTAYNAIIKISKGVELTGKVKVKHIYEFLQALSLGLNMLPGNGEMEKDFLAPVLSRIAKNEPLMKVLEKTTNLGQFIEETVDRLEEMKMVERETPKDSDPNMFS